MKYLHTTPWSGAPDLASGLVIRSAPGHPGFPIRLAAEIFLRAHHDLGGGRLTVWDPCCGVGGLLCTVGFLHPDKIAHIVASDIDPDAVGIAQRNLSLLTPEGRSVREAELRARPQRPHTLAALAALGRLQPALAPGQLQTLRADAAAPPAPPVGQVDLVLADLPYGKQVGFQGLQPPFAAVAGGVRPHVRSGGLLVLVCPRKTGSLPEGFERIRKLKAPLNRAVWFLRRFDGGATRRTDRVLED